MPAVFLSYRRADCPDTVKLIHERLKARLPRWHVFYDHTSIQPGEPFPECLKREVTSADVVLVIVGPNWLQLLRERQSWPVDHVREEVSLAIHSGRVVVPVTVVNAALPSENDLSDFSELRLLAGRNGRPIRPEPDFDNDIERLATFLDQQAPNEVVGTVLAGRYKIVREIGAGGMGVVYVAEQLQPKRTVAVKLIKPGMDSKEVLARFDAERQALAVMDHPNVAKVLDAGTAASGRPFFVMEYVKGEPITEFCDVKRLTPDERVALVQTVCQAVQHAHQKGIIHRDIKPSNVLVELVDGRPEPKVIDFGLAKALGYKLTDKTLVSETGRTVGTLLYSSPEQAAGRTHEIDTRTDIYSLGALLYELLAGTPPFTEDQLRRIGDDAMKRAIIETEPSKPSTKLSSSNALPSIAANRRTDPARLTRLVRGDLDRIAMKSLEKEPKARYSTASDLADDLRRYLAGEPVRARPVRGWERAWKWAKRRPVVAGLSAALALAITAGTVASWLFAAEVEREAANARAERDVAKEQKRRTRAALDTMISMDMVERLGSQKELTRGQREFLQTALGYYREFATEAGTDEEGRKLEAHAHFRVGYVLSVLGQNEEAISAYRGALPIYKRLAADFPTVPEYRGDLAHSHHNLGYLLNALGQREAAEAEYGAALAIHEKLAADFPAVPDYRSDLAGSHNNLGAMFSELGRREAAEAKYRAALAIHEKLAADFPAVPDYRRELATSHNNLGILLYGQGRRESAEAEYRAALAVREKLAADFPAVSEYRRDLAISHNNLGALLVGLGQREAAEAVYHAALAIQEKLVTDFPARPAYRGDLARSHHNLADLLRDLGRREAAEAEYRAALAVREKLAADFPAVPEYRGELARGHNSMGALLDGLGLRQAAEAEYRAALSLQKKLAAEFPAEPAYRHDLATSHNNLGIALRDLGRREAAEAEYRAGLATNEKLAADFPAVPEYRGDLAHGHHNLGILLYDLGRREAAEPEYRAALAVFRKLAADFPAVPGYRRDLATSHDSLGVLLRDLGRREAAEAKYRAALAIQAQLAAEFPAVPEYRGDLARGHNNLGILLYDLGRREAAEAEYRAALAVREKLAADFPAMPDYRRDLAASHNCLGVLLADLGRREVAEAEYRAALAVHEKLAADFPTVPEYAIGLGGDFCNLGNLLLDNGDAATALGWQTKAVNRLALIVASEPRLVEARQFLRNAYYGRASDLTQLKRYSEALPDWDAALKFDDGSARLDIRTRRVDCLARLNRAADAVHEAGELAADPAAAIGTLYDCACVMSQASAAPDNPAEDAHAARAVEMLRQAIAKGFNHIPHLLADADLAPLRRRADYATLLWDIADLPAAAPSAKP